ncbi:hypothetical protein D806_060960 [Mycolicibacterium smegmatis MKD8]|uniref:Uncharacterized protein n=1 Tax=Mycolicibacterium smegmatis (strain MKD8) TaxID=1214915 RepID=A0A2U9PZ84_MYCSE|nr:hypothetical protein D806_060960 [Mycolicibacterium smegmatis MKD8]
MTPRPSAAADDGQRSPVDLAWTTRQQPGADQSAARDTQPGKNLTPGHSVRSRPGRTAWSSAQSVTPQRRNAYQDRHQCNYQQRHRRAGQYGVGEGVWRERNFTARDMRMFDRDEQRRVSGIGNQRVRAVGCMGVVCVDQCGFRTQDREPECNRRGDDCTSSPHGHRAETPHNVANCNSRTVRAISARESTSGCDRTAMSQQSLSSTHTRNSYSAPKAVLNNPFGGLMSMNESHRSPPRSASPGLSALRRPQTGTPFKAKRISLLK